MKPSLAPATAVSAIVPPEAELDYAASCDLPTPWATFRLHAFVEPATGKEHVAVTLGDVANGEPVLARLHSECLTGDALFSLRCDCGPQLEAALQKIAEEGRGALFYLRQEGRGIGLVNKIRAYQLQDAGADTVEANEQLGFKPDLRNYGIGAQILLDLGIKSLRPITNNPRKLVGLEGYGMHIEERVPIVAPTTVDNAGYMATKRLKLGHLHLS